MVNLGGSSSPFNAWLIMRRCGNIAPAHARGRRNMPTAAPLSKNGRKVYLAFCSSMAKIFRYRSLRTDLRFPPSWKSLSNFYRDGLETDLKIQEVSMKIAAAYIRVPRSFCLTEVHRTRTLVQAEGQTIQV